MLDFEGLSKIVLKNEMKWKLSMQQTDDYTKLDFYVILCF